MNLENVSLILVKLLTMTLNKIEWDFSGQKHKKQDKKNEHFSSLQYPEQDGGYEPHCVPYLNGGFGNVRR